ncbi:MAG TPA: dihydrofolate reductase family protein [Candidatus Acidoferrales bacterium]|nr:dihydrofolate reductase family protein [Candidatus Acidoferrales bacterium]
MSAATDTEPIHVEPLDVLFEAPRAPGEVRGDDPPPTIAQRYGGPLAIGLRPDRPTVVANFVESLDGIVAIASGPRGGGSHISGAFEPDRFVMALLRALADVVVVGAGTVRSAPRHEWTPRGIAPDWAGVCDAWRSRLGLASQPTTVIVTAAGNVPADHAGLIRDDVPVVIATSRAGARRLASRGVPSGARVEVLSDAGSVEPERLVALLAHMGARLALCEGGPHLLAHLLGAEAVDELFLTLAPQVLGRTPEAARLGLAEGRAWDPGAARWAAVRSVRRAGSHLLLRYAFEGRPGPAA